MSTRIWVLYVKFGGIIAPKIQEAVKFPSSQKYSEHDMKNMLRVWVWCWLDIINFHITCKSKSELFHLFVKNWYVFIRKTVCLYMQARRIFKVFGEQATSQGYRMLFQMTKIPLSNNEIKGRLVSNPHGEDRECKFN